MKFFSGALPVADLLYPYGSGMHTLTGSLGQFERSNNTLARTSNLHSQLTNYPSFIPGSGHKPLNYTTATNFNTYHPAPSAHHAYPYTTVLGSHRSASGQSLLSGTTANANNQLYQTSAYPTGITSSNFNAHGSILHHLPASSQNAVLGPLPQTAVAGNHPLHFTASTLSAGSAIPTNHHFASLPRTAQSNFF